jgi:hypothetical protein
LLERLRSVMPGCHAGLTNVPDTSHDLIPRPRRGETGGLWGEGGGVKIGLDVESG